MWENGEVWKKIEDIFCKRVGKTEQGKPRLVLFAYCLLLTARIPHYEMEDIEMEMKEVNNGFEQVIAMLSHLDAEELLDVASKACSLLKKIVPKGKRATGVVPHQLEKNHEWVRYVAGDASMNGWESFVI